MDKKSREILEKSKKVKSKAELEKIVKQEKQAKAQKDKLLRKKIFTIGGISLAAVAVVVLVAILISSCSSNGTTTKEEEKKTKAVVETTKGSFTIQLDYDNALSVVNNFVKNAEAGLYDNSYFHEILPGMKIQGGYPETDKRPQGVGAYDVIEFVSNEVTHAKYSVCAPVMEEKDSKGTVTRSGLSKTQFYMLLSDQKSLDGKDTVFGKIIDGANVVEELAKLETVEQGEKNKYNIDPTEKSRPKDIAQAKIIKVKITQ